MHHKHWSVFLYFRGGCSGVVKVWTGLSGHVSCRGQPAYHPSSKLQRWGPRGQDGPQPAPPGLQAGDLDHAECRVRSHSFALDCWLKDSSWRLQFQCSLLLRTTDEDGRCPGLIRREAFTPGMYKLRFETASYWESRSQTSFYPYVEVT